MPYNFQATFETPLLGDLDQGRLASSRDLANAITKYYINTIKQGLPSGVPPTLPAPGLNPVTPPPYPIGASAYLTADSRRRVFFNVINSYLTAKDKIANKESLESLIRSIKEVQLKIQNTQRSIKNYTTQANLIAKEVAALPELIKELTSGLNKIVAIELQGIDELNALVEQLKQQGDSAVIEALFARELQTISLLKSFNIASVEGLLTLNRYISNSLTTANRVADRSGNLNEATRSYIESKLKGVIATILRLAEVAVNPLIATNYLKQLATTNSAASALLKVVNRIISIETITKPQLAKINREIEAEKRNIQNKLRKELADLQKKQAGLSKKPKSKKAEYFSRLAAEKNEQRKKTKAKLKRVSQKVKLTQKLVGLITVVVQRTAELEQGLQKEFTNLGINIPRQGLDSESQKVQNQYLEDYLREMGLPDFIPSALGAMNRATCSIVTFREYFERPVRTYTNYVRSIRDLEAALSEIRGVIQELVTGVKATKTNPKIPPISPNTSFKSVLLYVVKVIAAEVRDSQAKIAQQQQNTLQEQSKNQAEGTSQLKDTVEANTPTNSKLEDSKKKVQELKAKKDDLKAKEQKIKKFVKYAQYVTQATKGSLGLTSNIAQGNYSTANNLSHIENIVDGVYGFRILEASPINRQALINEKAVFRKNFYKLVVIDNLFRVFNLIIQDVNNEAFKREWNNLFSNIQNFTETELLAVDSFYKLITAPPKNPKELVDALNMLAVDVVSSVAVTNRLVALERKYLLKAKAAVNSLAQIDGLDNSKLQKLASLLNKQQSVILYVVRWIAAEINEFNIFLRKQVTTFIQTIRLKLSKEEDAAKKQFKDDQKINLFKQSNGLETLLLSAALGLAARSFWTGASWVGPTGSNHTVFSIGVFAPIKAKPVDGPSALVKNISKNFQKQLSAMAGIVTPPAPTLIPPIPFVGYK
jgi:hypothetical protein